MVVLAIVAALGLVLGVAACDLRNGWGLSNDHVHDLVLHIATESDCTHDGNELYWECKSCGKAFTASLVDEGLTPEDFTIKATGHVRGDELIPRTEATETRHGAAEHYACTVCGAALDESGKEIDVISHYYSEPAWSWSGYTSATATFTCTVCGEAETVSATVKPTKEKAPTCEEGGEYLYTASAQFKGKTYTDKAGYTLEKLGHNYGDWNVTAPTMEKAGSAVKTCSRCEEALTVELPALSDTESYTVVSKAPDCTNAGETTYTLIHEIYKDITFTVVIPATGHSYDAYEVTLLPTEEKAGKATATCSKCAEGAEGHVKEFTLPVLTDSRYVKTPITATCTQGGGVKYTIELDGVTFTFEATSSAFGHSYELTKFVWAEKSTGGYDVTVVFTCAIDKVEKQVAAQVSSETIPATCTAVSETTYTATVEFEGKTYTDFKVVNGTEKAPHELAYKFDEEGHWQECKNCDYKTESVAHTGWAYKINDDDTHIRYTTCKEHAAVEISEAHDWKDGACTKCEAKHENHALVWESDKDNHWEACTVCGYATPEEKHDYENGVCKDCGAGDPEYFDITGTFTASEKGYEDAQDVTTVKEQDATITFGKGTNKSNGPKYYDKGEAIRVYGGNSFTISVPEGYTIYKITFTFASGENKNEITVDTGIFNSTVWTGYAECVTFTIDGTSGHRRITSITIEYKSPEDVDSHTKLTKVEAKPATCEGSGVEAYWVCENCGRMFSDAEAKTEIFAPVEIPATGHSYGEPVFEWAVDYSSATAIFTCSVCYDEKSVAAEVSKETNGASCTKAGEVIYTVTVTFEEKTYTESKTVEVAELGHEWAGDWISDGNGKHYQKCVRFDDCKTTSTSVDCTLSVYEKIDEYYHSVTCEVCGYKVAQEAHDFGGDDDRHDCVCGELWCGNDAVSGEFTIDPAKESADAEFDNQGGSNITSSTNKSVDKAFGENEEIIITFDQGTAGTATRWWKNDSTLRMYKGSSFTVQVDGVITKILFNVSGNGTIEVADGNGTYNNKTWTGSSSSVTFNVTANINFASITISYEQKSGTHIWEATDNTEAANCVHGKLTEMKCVRCGKTEWVDDGEKTNEHKLAYEDIGNADVHRVYCTVDECDYETTEAHDIVEGECSKCGYVVPKHVHTWGEYKHDAGAWTHTATCTDPDCNETDTKDCMPEFNVCSKCGYEYKVDEILTALFALEAGEALPGTYELTGEIVAIEEISTSYNNATFTIRVGDREVVAYRAKNENNDLNLHEGDTVTITGSLKNYSGKYEFDAGCLITSIVHPDDEKEPEPEEKTLPAIFELGTATADSGSEKSSYTETNNGYTLTLTGLAKVYDGIGGLKLGTSSASGKFSFEVPAEVLSVELYIGQYNGKNVTVIINGTNYTITENGANGSYQCIKIDTSEIKTISLETSKPSSGDIRARIDKIVFRGESIGEEHVHVWGTATHVDGTWKHSVPCTAEGCDLTAPQELDCVPELNVCSECGYEYSEDEILTKLFALEGSSNIYMNGTYKLTGVVTEITDPAGTYTNVTFNFTVNDKTIVAFRAVGDGYYDTVAVGDTVTVTGTLVHWYDGQKEFTNSPVITELIPRELTDEERAAKIADAKAQFTLGKTEFTVEGETYELPTEYKGITLAWNVQDNKEYVSISGNILTVNKLPGEGTLTVTLKVTFSLGEVTDNDDITIALKAATEDEKSIVANLNMLFEQIGTTGWSGYAKHEVTFAQAGETNVNGTVVMDNASKQSSTITTMPVLAANNNTTYVTVTVTGVSISTVEFVLQGWSASKIFSKIAIQYTTNNKDWLDCSEALTGNLGTTAHTLASSVSIPAGVTSVRLAISTTASSNTQVGLSAIKLTVIEGGETDPVEPEPEPGEEGLLYALTQKTGGDSGYATSSDITLDDGTVWSVEGNSTMNPWRFGGKSITAVDRKLTGKTAISGKVTKVSLVLTDGGSITVHSVTLKVYSTNPAETGAEAISTKTSTGYTKDAEINFTASANENWTNCYYEIIFNVTVGSSNKYVQITSLQFYGEV